MRKTTNAMFMALMLLATAANGPCTTTAPEPEPNVGDACDKQTDCTGGFCVDGVCTKVEAPQGEGDAT